MKCQQCGRDVPSGAAFCCFCGTKIEAPVIVKPPKKLSQKMCPSCRIVFEAEHVYCNKCGRLLRGKEVLGRELYRIHMASKYEGEPTVGIAKAIGELIIYDDKVEFKRVMGNALGNAFGLLGMVVAAKNTPPLEEYAMTEIASARQGRYAGMMPTLIITLKNGTVFSFCGFADGNAVQKAVAYIEEYRLLN